MPALPSAETAFQLIQLRTQLLGDGNYRMDYKDPGVQIVSILPGDGYYAVIDKRPEEREVARLFHPSTKPLSEELNLRNPLSFAFFMHNLDWQIFRGSGERFPVDAIHLVDLAYVSRDAEIQDLIEPLLSAEAYNAHAPSRWKTTRNLRDLTTTALKSEDQPLRQAAERMEDVLCGRLDRTEFNADDHAIHWNDQVDLWLQQVWGLAPKEVAVEGEYAWREILTPPGLVAALKSAGCSDVAQRGALHPWLGPPSKPVKKNASQRGYYLDSGFQLLPPDRRFFAFDSANGVLTVGEFSDSRICHHGPDELPEVLWDKEFFNRALVRLSSAVEPQQPDGPSLRI